jgi:hypothetical protein
LNQVIQTQQAVAVYQSQPFGLSCRPRPEALLIRLPLSLIMIAKSFQHHSIHNRMLVTFAHIITALTFPIPRYPRIFVNFSLSQPFSASIVDSFHWLRSEASVSYPASSFGRLRQWKSAGETQGGRARRESPGQERKEGIVRRRSTRSESSQMFHQSMQPSRHKPSLYNAPHNTHPLPHPMINILTTF